MAGIFSSQSELFESFFNGSDSLRKVAFQKTLLFEHVNRVILRNVFFNSYYMLQTMLHLELFSFVLIVA